MAIIRPQIISKEAIKPSSPTPTHLRTYKLSSLDQLSPHIYVPMVFFYPGQGCHNACEMPQISRRLKVSLSDTLTRYYPFAGRLDGAAAVDCNDEGVDFYEARAGFRLLEILQKPEPEALDMLYPSGILYNDSYKASLLVVQLTFFACGGMAIATCIVHKIGDGGTMSYFIADWAATARSDSRERTCPEFISALVSEPNDDPPNVVESKLEMGNTVTRRFVFPAAKISELKAMVASNSGPELSNPTRVEVVTSLIFKCAVAASRSGSSRPSVLLQPVNLRPRLSPPLPQKSVGNFSWFYSLMARDERDRELAELVGAMKKGLGQFCDKYTRNMTPTQSYSVICEGMKEAKRVLNKNESINVFKGSSLCGYPLNQVDFGWGKPLWVGFSKSRVKDTFHLTDEREGGIEAWVTLEEPDMANFECNQELLAFASLNPSVIGPDCAGLIASSL